MELALYHPITHYEVLDRVETLLKEQELCYSSYDLKIFGLEDEDVIADAVRRAMRVCLTCGVPLEGNFKLIYLGGSEGLMPAWELSETAFKLSILNADSGIPSVARWQLRLIREWQGKF